MSKNNRESNPNSQNQSGKGFGLKKESTKKSNDRRSLVCPAEATGKCLALDRIREFEELGKKSGTPRDRLEYLKDVLTYGCFNHLTDCKYTENGGKNMRRSTSGEVILVDRDLNKKVLDKMLDTIAESFDEIGGIN